MAARITILAYLALIRVGTDALLSWPLKRLAGWPDQALQQSLVALNRNGTGSEHEI